MIALLIVSLLASNPAGASCRGRGRSCVRDSATLRLLSTSSTIPGGECSGQTITGTRNQAMSLTRPTGAFCTKGNGGLTWLTANQPRCSMISGKASCLFEISKLNVVPRSQEFENALWAKGNTTVTPDSITAPDGTLTADILVDNTTAGSHRIIQGPLAVTASGNYTWSAFGKSGSYNFMGIGSDNSTRRAVVNLSNGTVSNVSAGTTARATQYSGGYWRLEVTGAAEADGTEYVTVYLGDTAANADPLTGSFTGTGTGTISIWGAQLEPGLTASSYYPTAGTSATRGADIPSVATPKMPTTNWCMGMKISPFTTWSGAENETILTGGTFGTANAFSIYLNFPNSLVVQQWNGAGNQTSVTAAVLSQAPHDVVVRHTGSALEVVVDGVLAGTTTGAGDGSFSAWPATIYLGNDATGIGAIGNASNIRFGASTGACNR